MSPNSAKTSSVGTATESGRGRACEEGERVPSQCGQRAQVVPPGSGEMVVNGAAGPHNNKTLGGGGGRDRCGEAQMDEGTRMYEGAQMDGGAGKVGLDVLRSHS